MSARMIGPPPAAGAGAAQQRDSTTTRRRQRGRLRNWIRRICGCDDAGASIFDSKAHGQQRKG
eukprot:6500331-Pyramimonas_sp.AAC.1